MSLSHNITEVIDKVIETFISRVSEKYNLDNKELKCIWNGRGNINFEEVSKPDIVQEVSKPDIVPEDLLKCNKTELIAMCKSYGYKCSGAKSILLNRLLGKEQDEKSKKKTSKNKTKNPAQTPVVKKLLANIPSVIIRRNQFNNYEHPESGLVFDNIEKIVIGKQNDDGSVNDLTEEDIDQCNAFKFKYTLPENLDGNSNLTNVKVDEIDDEDDEEKDSDNEELVDESELEMEIEEDDEDELVEEEYENV